MKITASHRFWTVALLGVLVVITTGVDEVQAQGGQEPIFTTDFSPDEFAERRGAVFDAIGPHAVALLQGAPIPMGYTRFRQTNTFYYLSGIETPGAYLLLDGRDRRTTLYLPHRSVRREQLYGKILSADDDELVRELTGIDVVRPVTELTEDVAWLASNVAGYGGPRVEAIYTPFHPAGETGTSRWWAARSNAEIASDPWDGRPSREQRFIDLLRTRVPSIELRDLTPITDRMRVIKSPAEVALVRRAAELAGHALLESMRSTRPGIYEYELDAVAKYIFFRHGAQAEAYRSLVASGTNAIHPHYHAGTGRLDEGKLVLMDYSARS